MSVEDQGGDGWRLQPSDAEDVRWAYRVLLGRAAESDAVVQEKVGVQRLELLRAFLTSGELRSKLGRVAGGALAGVDPALLQAADAQALAWVGQRFGLEPGRAGPAEPGASLLELVGGLMALLAGSDPGSSEAAALERGSAAIRETLAQAGRIAASPLFDARAYAERLGQPGLAHPALHYLTLGEALGLAPGDAFSPAEYRRRHPVLAEAEGNLLLHYEDTGRRFGWTAPAVSPAQDNPPPGSAPDYEGAIRASVDFDPAYYRAQLSPGVEDHEDLAWHYYHVGEREGLRPSPTFDPRFYALLYPDVVRTGMNRLLHYELYGRREGRLAHSVVDELDFPNGRIDPAKPTILLALHEASHTGAPILGWNLARALASSCNVVIVLRAGGSLEEALADVACAVVGPLPPSAMTNRLQLGLLAARLVEVYRPLYAIANSVETRHIALALRDAAVPIVALVHEFASTNPLEEDGVPSPFFGRCAAIVFPAELVRRSALRGYREITVQNSHILPQGRSAVPPFGRPAIAGPTPAKRHVQAQPRRPLGAVLSGRRGEGVFTIVGLGTVELRKGVDLFIATGTALATRHPTLDFQMLWIGHRGRGPAGGYDAFIEEQVARSGLGERLHVFAATDDLEPVYQRADALLLASRLDPLPNISIDAALHDLPVVCFRDASGMAELLEGRAELAHLVAAHLDTGDAAERLARLALDPALAQATGWAMGAFGRSTFDMAAYARRLDQLGRQGAAKAARAAQEAALIAGSGLMEPDVYLEPGEGAGPAPARPCDIYLDRTRQVNFHQAKPLCGAGVRRPAPGFHPFVYATQAPGFPTDGSRDPLAHFVEHGQPAGPWRVDVVRPASQDTSQLTRRRSLRRAVGHLLRPGAGGGAVPADAALHGHFYYTDDIAEFMAALDANQSRIDLFLTTGDGESAEKLRDATQHYVRGQLEIAVVGNRGRDIAPFLALLGRWRGRYDIVGHVHGKKSEHTRELGADIGWRWRKFLWANLLGPECAAADAAIAALRQDRRLGLLFPQDEFTVPWDENYALASELAARMGVALPLPAHLDFPVGAMFWARLDALRPLADLRLGSHDFPPEPLPNDGTGLHALERLLPFVAARAGYRHAVTFVPTARR